MGSYWSACVGWQGLSKRFLGNLLNYLRQFWTQIIIKINNDQFLHELHLIPTPQQTYQRQARPTCPRPQFSRRTPLHATVEVGPSDSPAAQGPFASSSFVCFSQTGDPPVVIRLFKQCVSLQGDLQATGRMFSISAFSNLGSKILRPEIKSPALSSITPALSTVSFVFCPPGTPIGYSTCRTKEQSSVRALTEKIPSSMSYYRNCE